MTTEHQIIAAATLAALLGIIGVFTIGMLMRAWRRASERERDRPAPGDVPDLWEAAGRRLTAKMSPFPRNEEHGLPEEEGPPPWEQGYDDFGDDDDAFDPDPDEDDDDEPWR